MQRLGGIQREKKEIEDELSIEEERREIEQDEDTKKEQGIEDEM